MSETEIEKTLSRQWLNRKDLASILDVTVTQIRKNERKWMLHKHRDDLNARCVRYRSSGVRLLLIERGWLIDLRGV